MMVTELKPWFAVARPHEDIREGRLDEAVFAANLWAVVQGTAPEVYTDPEAFFQKTYLTQGLTNVLRKVSGALTGKAETGDRILNLQTAFGGGKTHILIALWHLAKHIETIRRSEAAAEVREVLGELPEAVKAVAVFTNQMCDAVQGRQTPEGVHTRTLWGELALQLGGMELYRKVEANDQARTVPQGLFVEILQRAAPCLILLDELADYCVGASAVEVGSVTLADQTISFIQQLTEATGQVPGVAVVATLPASHLEVASSEKGQEILNRLERRFGRMSADIKPVADEEIFEVVRRRLFESVGDPAEHRRVAEAYWKLYQAHRNELPSEVTRAAYKERLLKAYPFHPELIDAFYLRWGSHADFQRTRGVLRMLASIVGNLWQRRNNETQSQPLIQPCHVRWTINALNSKLTRLWGIAYEAVVAADVIGERANATIIDEERGEEYLREKIAQGLAASILLGSFGGQAERAGYSSKDLKLCVSRPVLNWGYSDGALLALEERGFYLHTASAGNLGKRYWFGTKPTLTKLIVQYRQQYASQTFSEEVLELLQAQTRKLHPEPATWRIVINPSVDLPEQKALALLILSPQDANNENGEERLIASPAQARIRQLSEKCGSRDRIHRNTLLFLVPSQRRLSRLQRALREVQALEAVQRDYREQLDDEQRRELQERLAGTRQKALDNLGATYSYVARVEGSQVVIKPLPEARPTFAEHLQAVWHYVVEEEEWVLRRVGLVTLQENGLVLSEGGTRIKEAIEAFLRYTDKPMIASPQAVLLGLTQACAERLIGIGRGVNLQQLQRRWCGKPITLDPNEEGLWIIPPFKLEPAPIPTGGEATTIEVHSGTEVPSVTPLRPQLERTEGDEQALPKRPVKRIRIRGNVPPESWGDIFRSFVIPSARMNLKQLKLGVDFEIKASEDHPLDADDPAMKAMREAARQLGLEIDFEVDP